MKKLLLPTVLAVSTVFASAGIHAESKVNAFADCGIGAGLFDNDTAAIISNVIWDLGTTALTSATASPETCEGYNQDAAAFIYDSYERLVEETAIGEGRHIETLLSMVEIDEDSKAEVLTTIRQNIAEIVSSDSYLEASKLEKASQYYYSFMDAVKA